jgi:hypothetical protein
MSKSNKKHPKKSAAERTMEAAEKRSDAKKARQSAAFRAASHSGNFDAQIAVVTPIARRNLLNGGVDADDLIGDVADLVGTKNAAKVVDNEWTPGRSWTDYCDALHAAFALGVVTGQMLTHGFFEKGGAR